MLGLSLSFSPPFYEMIICTYEHSLVQIVSYICISSTNVDALLLWPGQQGGKFGYEHVVIKIYLNFASHLAYGIYLLCIMIVFIFDIPWLGVAWLWDLIFRII